MVQILREQVWKNMKEGYGCYDQAAQPHQKCQIFRIWVTHPQFLELSLHDAEILQKALSSRHAYSWFLLYVTLTAKN